MANYLLALLNPGKPFFQVRNEAGMSLEPGIRSHRNGLVQSSLRLRFTAQKEHFRNGVLKLKCLASIPSVYRVTQETATEVYLKHEDNETPDRKKVRKESVAEDMRMSAGES